MLDKNKVEKFISAAMKYKGDKYSQPKRMERGYSDCSSLIYKALRDVGLLDTSQTSRTISTKYMRDGDPRFERINMNQAQRGDILWWQKPNSSRYEGHVAIVLGGGRVLEAIYEGVVEKSSKRIPYQRAYRIKTLKATESTKPVKVTSVNREGTVKAGTLNVRSGNSTSYNVLGQLKKGAKVKVTGKAGSWHRIDYKGKHGFVSGQYIDLTPETHKIVETPKIVEELAQQQFEWSKEAVEWAVDNGVSDGLRLQDSCTREEVITMIYRALNGRK